MYALLAGIKKPAMRMLKQVIWKILDRALAKFIMRLQADYQIGALKHYNPNEVERQITLFSKNFRASDSGTLTNSLVCRFLYS